MTVERLLPNAEAEDLLSLTRQIADAELAPIASEYEAQERYPERAFRVLADAGLLGLAYPEEYGGGGQPFEVYLQVLEELAARWAAVAVAVSVHGLACFSLSEYGTTEQKKCWLPSMLAGDCLGAYSLSEPHAGSDPAAIVCSAKRLPAGYRINGTKAWITNGGKAGFYTLFARTSDQGRRGISCFLTPGQLEGLTFGVAERKMGLSAVPTTTAHWDDVLITADRLIGVEGQGLPIALSALDTGRLGIAAIAVGLAQSAMETAIAYAKERQTFGKRVIDHQGVGFMLADMAAGVATARAMYLDAARKKDRGRQYAQEASVAKLIATDTAMRVTTDAVQVMGGIGCTKDVPAERYMREAKVMQIFEGTNQIQRLVISRQLAV